MLQIKMRLFWQRLGGFLNQNEKLFLALLSVVIVVSGTFWYRQYSLTHSSGPSIGGTYIEGIVGSKPELESVAAKLTKAGLFYLNSEGQPTSLLIDSYEVNADKTQYVFLIKADVPAEEINNDLQNNIEILGNATSSVEGQRLTLTLEQANPNILILLTQPLFDYGSYKLTSITDDTAIFSRSSKAHAEPTYINKIIVHAYTDQATLNDALTRRKIDGMATDSSVTVPKNYQTMNFPLTKSYAVILNTNVSPFRNLDQRKKLLAGDGTSTIKSFVLTVPRGDNYTALIEQATSQWTQNGVKIQVVRKSLDEMNSLLVSRDFQAVITGIDYAVELDPYYLWSSTQILPPGNNVSGIKSELIDQFLSSIRQETSLAKRSSMLTTLSMLIQEEGVGKILKQEEGSMILSDEINFIPPFSAQSVSDHYQTIHLWSVD